MSLPAGKGVGEGFEDTGFVFVLFILIITLSIGWGCYYVLTWSQRHRNRARAGPWTFDIVDYFTNDLPNRLFPWLVASYWILVLGLPVVFGGDIEHGIAWESHQIFLAFLLCSAVAELCFVVGATGKLWHWFGPVENTAVTLLASIVGKASLYTDVCFWVISHHEGEDSYFHASFWLFLVTVGISQCLPTIYSIFLASAHTCTARGAYTGFDVMEDSFHDFMHAMTNDEVRVATKCEYAGLHFAGCVFRHTSTLRLTPRSMRAFYAPVIMRCCMEDLAQGIIQIAFLVHVRKHPRLLVASITLSCLNVLLALGLVGSARHLAIDAAGETDTVRGVTSIATSDIGFANAAAGDQPVSARGIERALHAVGSASQVDTAVPTAREESASHNDTAVPTARIANV